MKKEIIINSALNEVRIAITEDSKLAEFFIELPEKERSVGNIYLGKVSRVITGINAAFIDIGFQSQDAFLHFSDVDESLENIITDEDEDEGLDFAEEETENEVEETTTKVKKSSDSAAIALRKVKYVKKETSDDSLAVFKTKRLGSVQINLEPKQDVIVQVVREAYGTKGVRVTTKIAIPGRYVVLLPFDNMIGISKKISSFQERKRLRYLARTTLPKGFGCIIRTAAHGKSETELVRDWENLIETWNDIERKVKKATGPMLLYQDMALATSVIRDLFTNDVRRVVVDSKKLYKEITSYLKWSSPALVDKVELYTGREPIFEAFNVEKELEQTYKRKVQLQSGGSIVIEQTEAMFVIDVNSGRSISEKQQEQNALNTNLEAVREIAKQVRLRDMAGLILIDFIDVMQDNHKKKIFNEMKRELGRDRAKAVVYPLTQLSIMQITRQRINQYIAEKMTETCPVCHGRGRVASKGVLLNSIERWLRNFRTHSREFRLVLLVHPHIANYLSEGTISRLSRLMIKYFVKIKLEPNENVHIDQFQFISVRQQKEITQEYQ